MTWREKVQAAMSDCAICDVFQEQALRRMSAATTVKERLQARRDFMSLHRSKMRIIKGLEEQALANVRKKKGRRKKHD